MRQFIYLLSIFFVTGCKETSYFNTSNDVYKKEGVVHLLDGTEKKGPVTILFETGTDVGRFIRFQNGSVEEKILVDSIQFYKVGADYYYPKKIDLEYTGTERLLFVKRLTGENSRINLYELFQQAKKSEDGAAHFLYFISVPSQDRLDAWSIGSVNLVPNFDEKMSRIVKDCPALAEKIRQKSKGYFLAKFKIGDQSKLEVFKRIADEYNACK